MEMFLDIPDVKDNKSILNDEISVDVNDEKILSLSFGVIWKNDNICIGILKRSPKVENDFKKNQTYIQILKA